MTRQLIPLQGGAVNAHQTINVQLGDNFVDITFDYRTIIEQWSVKIEQDGNILVPSVMLEPNINILQHYPDLAVSIGAIYFTGLEATLDNLGSDNNLVWESPS